MDIPRPLPASENRLDRLGAWMRGRKWRQWLVLYSLAMIVTALLLAIWIGVAYLRGSTERDAGAVALNIVLTAFVATFGLIVMHFGLYRRFRQADLFVPGGTLHPPKTRLAERPLPHIDWPWTLKLRHATLYMISIATLLYVFIPYGNQLAIIRFLAKYNAGMTSAGSLAALIFGLFPMAALSLLVMMLTHRQMKRRDAGLLDAPGRLLLEAEISWLFSFAAAFVTALFVCQLGGGMVAAYL